MKLFHWELVVLHLCSHTVGQRYCTVYSFDQMLWLLFILLLILCGYHLRTATLWGQHLFLWKVGDINDGWIMYICTSETVTVAICCQWYAQPLSRTVSCRNNSYNILVLAWWPLSEIIRTLVCVSHLQAKATIWGWYTVCVSGLISEHFDNLGMRLAST